MKMGIMATGWIADVMARTIAEMPEVESYAVASRSEEKAKAFAEKYGFQKAYGSYEELVKDEEVELIYVATPHSHHYECAKLCLEHGKPVLVEKAFTVNSKQARELVELAREKKVFLAEAFWTRYMPSRKMIVDLIDSGIIGEVTSVMSNFGASLENRERLVKPELAGGALLDLGVYPINFALMYVKGDVKNVSAVSIQTEAGVDMTNSVTLTFENNVIALLHSDMRAQMMGGGVIYGREGYIAVKGAINPEEILVFNRDRQVVKNVEIPKQITGYEYEVKACMEALKAGKLECEEMPHSETLKLMELLDEIRSQWGMKYPCEE